jgi:hypothetical protein
MECGKSWFATACTAAELTNRRHVVYIHFEEADPSDTVQRLQALEVADETILGQLRFVGPEERGRADWLARLLDPPPVWLSWTGSTRP